MSEHLPSGYVTWEDESTFGLAAPTTIVGHAEAIVAEAFRAIAHARAFSAQRVFGLEPDSTVPPDIEAELLAYLGAVSPNDDPQ